MQSINHHRYLTRKGSLSITYVFWYIINYIYVCSIFIQLHIKILNPYETNHVCKRMCIKDGMACKRSLTVGGAAHDETEAGAHRTLPSYSLDPQPTRISLRNTRQQHSGKKGAEGETFPLRTDKFCFSHTRVQYLLVSKSVGGSESPSRSNSTALWTSKGIRWEVRKPYG